MHCIFGGPVLSGSQALAQSAAGANSDPEPLSRDDRQWPMAAKNYAATRFGSLDQIDVGNVLQLTPAWTFSVGADRGQEAAPLIVNATMYVVAPYAGPYPNGRAGCQKPERSFGSRNSVTPISARRSRWPPGLKAKVYVGNSSGEMGVRGRLTARVGLGACRPGARCCPIISSGIWSPISEASGGAHPGMGPDDIQADAAGRTIACRVREYADTLEPD
jgi:hypothetical protein